MKLNCSARIATAENSDQKATDSEVELEPCRWTLELNSSSQKRELTIFLCLCFECSLHRLSVRFSVLETVVIFIFSYWRDFPYQKLFFFVDFFVNNSYLVYFCSFTLTHMILKIENKLKTTHRLLHVGSFVFPLGTKQRMEKKHPLLTSKQKGFGRKVFTLPNPFEKETLLVFPLARTFHAIFSIPKLIAR